MDEIESVMQVERAWTDAHQRGDFEIIARLMADDYLKIESDGALSDRASTLSKYKPETRHWDKAQGDEYLVRVYGDVALVFGRWSARGVNNGEHFDYAARFLSVYVKRNGEWMMVAEQATEIKSQEFLNT